MLDRTKPADATDLRAAAAALDHKAMFGAPPAGSGIANPWAQTAARYIRAARFLRHVARTLDALQEPERGLAAESITAPPTGLEMALAGELADNRRSITQAINQTVNKENVV